MSTQPHSRSKTLPVVLTRWVLLISISYAIILSAPADTPLWPHQVVIFGILASNLVLMWLLARTRSWELLSAWATGIDIATVSMAISVAGHVQVNFYLVFFTVLILAAVVTGRGLMAMLSFVACLAYAALMWADGGSAVWRSPELLVRLPVLFGVGLYFGTAVQEARREQQRREERLNNERKKALAALTEMGKAAFSGGYAGPVLYEIAGWVQELVEFDRCSLLVFGEGGERGFLAASGDDPSIEVIELQVSDYPELAPVLAGGEFTELHPDDPPELWARVSAQLPDDSPFKTFIVIPIKRADDVTGAFYLRDSDPQRRLSDAQKTFCFQAAQMAAAFIFEYDLLADLERRSQTDELTGLMSYGQFVERAEGAIAATNGRPVSIGLINIDELSEINERHDHQVGTEVIRHVGQRLVAALGEDSVCRYGGDEFVVLLDGDADTARVRLQQEVLQRLEDTPQDLPVRPRASAGIACTSEDGTTYEQLFVAAQGALRHSKGAGGDAVEVASAV